MEVIINQDARSGSYVAAQMVAQQIREKPTAVLGLATGSTPLLLYRELIQMHREEDLDFSSVTTFNLDEYIGLSKGHEQSYHRFMWENLFQHINIKAENVHLPDGTTENVPATCEAYEQAIVAAGGIDIQILGIGTDGHVGFNEPTSSFASRTRIKTLTQQAVAKLAPEAGFDFPDEMLFPERLKAVQAKANEGDPAALDIFATIGIYLGYSLPHYKELYDFKNALILGRVTSGRGGEVILETAQEILNAEFPDLAEEIELHVPDEQSRRVGQAVAAASLPCLNKSTLSRIQISRD